MKNKPVSNVVNAALGHWPVILPALGISVPDGGKHGACPACGGKDRFRFDDKDGRGTWFCNQCGSGDGLDLVRNALELDVKAAAEAVASTVGSDRAAVTNSNTPARKEAPEIPENETWEAAQTAPDHHPYLTRKGLGDLRLAVVTTPFRRGCLYLPFINIKGEQCGAQWVDAYGKKGNWKGSHKKGAFILIRPERLPEEASNIIIAEGAATAISAAMCHDGVAVAAIDEGNLKPVAQALREKYPQAKIIIAADNDWYSPEEKDQNGKPKQNGGLLNGKQAASTVAGWLALPPGEVKMDWDDYRQSYGIDEMKKAFMAGMQKIDTEALRKARYVLGDGIVLDDREVAALEALNKIYTHVTVGGKHRVVSMKPCQTNGNAHVFEELAQFKNYFLHQPHIAKRSPGAAWLQWPGKAYRPDGVGFYPCPEKCPETVYNLFNGWGVRPLAGDVTPYLEHLEKTICNGNQQAYEYVLGWLAHLVQKPDEKPSVALVLKAIPGTGKGSMVKPVMQIMGMYGIQVNGAGQIAGRFNSTMANRIFIFADEVTINNGREADKLKGIISEPTINLERKGIDPEPMPNYARLIFASNSEQVLRASIRERRYLVLEPSAAIAQQKGYFDRLHGWINNNGAAHLLDYLLRYDIKDFDPRRAPVTAALVREILSNLPPAEQYVYTELCSEAPFRGEARLIITSEIDRFMAQCRDDGIELTLPAARRLLGRVLAGLGLEQQGRRGRGCGGFYDLPAREDIQSWDAVRSAFALQLNSDIENVFGETFY
ncbi:toprim domain-containing protein [Salmonella enterica]|nr:toprim domain-containing protein [Salmonella enterica]